MQPHSREGDQESKTCWVCLSIDLSNLILAYFIVSLIQLSVVPMVIGCAGNTMYATKNSVAVHLGLPQ